MIRVRVNNNDTPIIGVYFLKTAITKIAIGAKTVWDKISSCFGSGIWISQSNWSSTETWKN